MPSSAAVAVLSFPPRLRRLVTDGPFGIVRNPIIVAELMVIWGEALYVTSLVSSSTRWR
jgi:protein-S-isoprenylcysteine O-methyltransferase Ste14